MAETCKICALAAAEQQPNKKNVKKRLVLAS